jgi:hypothetical protein
MQNSVVYWSKPNAGNDWDGEAENVEHILEIGLKFNWQHEINTAVI